MKSFGIGKHSRPKLTASDKHPQSLCKARRPLLLMQPPPTLMREALMYRRQPSRKNMDANDVSPQAAPQGQHLLTRWAQTALFFLLFSLLSFSSTARGQVGAASLSGQVQDATGACHSGRHYYGPQQQTGDIRAASSNSAGAFTFAALPSGNYEITISHSGFQSLTRSGHPSRSRGQQIGSRDTSLGRIDNGNRHCRGHRRRASRWITAS